MTDQRAALVQSHLVIGRSPALLVVDASVAFTDPNCALGAPVEAELLVLQKLLDTARSRRWPIYFSTVAYSDPNQASVFRTKIPALNLLTMGSELVEINPQLERANEDQLLVKTHASCFHDTTLDHDLRANKVDSLVICGFTTSGCVRATVVDALQHNYPSIVISDATADRDPKAHEANLYDLQAKYAEVWTSMQLYEELKKEQGNVA